MWLALASCAHPDDPAPPVDPSPTPDSALPSDSGPPPCFAGHAGTHFDRTLVVDGVERTYLYHVPDDLPCGAPLVVDLHGAYGGPEPEQAYAFAEAVAEADRQGFALVRPRSTQQSGWYRWDGSPSDLDANEGFLVALADELSAKLDSGPRLVVGYSSGADMAAVLLADGAPFAGYALVAGALWWDRPWTPDPAARVYTNLGYRDTGWSTLAPTLDALAAALPADAVFVDAGSGGHRLAGWHYARAVPFLRDGVRPVAAPADPGWEVLPDAPRGLAHAGGPWVGDADGRTFAAADFAPGPPAGPRPVTGLCDRWAAAVELVDLTDGARESVPPDPATGYAWAYGVACDADEELVVGFPAYGRAPGGPWTALPVSTWAEWFDVALGDELAVLVGAYGQLAWRVDGGWSMADLPADVPADTWLYGTAVAGRRAWAVGADGVILSAVAGGAWHLQRRGGLDLYAVGFDAGGQRGAAVGHGGVALVTSDGGETWAELPTGTDAAWSGAAVDADGVLRVYGEDGAVQRALPR